HAAGVDVEGALIVALDQVEGREPNVGPARAFDGLDRGLEIGAGLVEAAEPKQELTAMADRQRRAGVAGQDVVEASEALVTRRDAKQLQGPARLVTTAGPRVQARQYAVDHVARVDAPVAA